MESRNDSEQRARRRADDEQNGHQQAKRRGHSGSFPKAPELLQAGVAGRDGTIARVIAQQSFQWRAMAFGGRG